MMTATKMEKKMVAVSHSLDSIQLLLLLLLLCAAVHADNEVQATPGQVQEFCQADVFIASCPEDHVIIMKSAFYGRMRFSRCVRGDYGYIGCAKDDLDFMDSKCSGASSLLSVDKRKCQLSQPIIVTSQSGSLASVTSQHMGLGTVECPWRIRASPGQHITLFLRYFHPEKTQTDSSSPATTRGDKKLTSNCYELATVHQSMTTGESRSGESRSITSCDGQQRGQHELFTSSSNEISVQFVGRMMLKTLGRFIISYRAVGCADMAAPPNTTVVRDGDRLTVRCNHSEQIWYMVCINASWHGETINCNNGDGGAWKMRQMFNVGSFPYGILVVVAIGVALGVFCGGLLLACVVVYMRRDKDQLESRDELGPDYQYSVDGYYTTRRPSVDHAAPFIRGSDDDPHLNEFTTTTTSTTTPRVHHGCLVVDKSLAGYGTATTPASRLCHHATPTPVTSCADCQSDYDRRRVAKATAAAPDSSVDVTMTTTTSSRQKDKAHRHHVYELPHVI